MNSDYVMDLTKQAMRITAYLGGPMLIGSMVVGILVSLFQTVTQINEQTLTFIPKVIVISVTLVIFGPWLMETIVNFTTDLILSIPSVVARR